MCQVNQNRLDINLSFSVLYIYSLINFQGTLRVAWMRADTKAILTLNSLLVTQNPRYALLDQVKMDINWSWRLALPRSLDS